MRVILKNLINSLSLFGMLAILVGCTVLSSCEEPTDEELLSLLPEAAGGVNEIYVFCTNRLWEDTIGGSLRELLEEPLTNLPQPEKKFTLFQFDPDAMNKARLTHRNIIEVTINDRNENKKPKLVRSADVWSRGQLMYDFKGPDINTVLALIKAELPAVVREIEQKEIERLHARFDERANTNAMRKIARERGIQLKLPHKLTLHENRKDFAWLESRGTDPQGLRVIHQGVFVYHYPYVHDSVFKYESLIKKRNEVLKVNVPGSSDNQYLTTQMLPGEEPSMKEINYNGQYAVEMRGQFTMHNGFMGGPFMSITTVDTINQQVVTVEGYCYAPQLEKRDYLKEMEAVVYSTSFTKTKASN